jgi:surface antigen
MTASQRKEAATMTTTRPTQADFKRIAEEEAAKEMAYYQATREAYDKAREAAIAIKPRDIV